MGALRILKPPWRSGSPDSTEPPVKAPQSRPLRPLRFAVLVPRPPNLGDLRRQPLNPPETQASELPTGPPPTGESESPPTTPANPGIPDPSQKARSRNPASERPAPPLPRDLGVPSSPLLQEPPGPASAPPAPAFRIQVSPPSSPPQPDASRLGGRARVAMATRVYFALGTHSSRCSAPPPRPSNPGLSESRGTGEGDWGPGWGRQSHRDTQSGRDLWIANVGKRHRDRDRVREVKRDGDVGVGGGGRPRDRM